MEVLALVAAEGDGDVVLCAYGPGQRVEVGGRSGDLEGVWVVALCPGYPAVALLPPHAHLVGLGLQVVVLRSCQEVERANLEQEQMTH